MFEPQDRPRVYFLPPGVDFSRAVVAGFRARMPNADPITTARAEIWVNTNRTLFRLTEIFAQHRPLLMPKMSVIEDIANRPFLGLPPAVPRLERILDIASVIRGMIAADPGFAHPAVAFDLADSVARLFAEMQEEQVDPDALASLDVVDQSGHWQRALAFLTSIAHHYGPGKSLPDAEGRQRAAVDALIAGWADTPPQHPVIVAGSTGSRGTTTRVMTAVARLPQGALILPGLDRDLPMAVWDVLARDDQHQDHPQYRFARLLSALDLDPSAIEPWLDVAPADPLRNRLVSLAMRPPPLTSQWRDEVADLGDLAGSIKNLTLIAADSPRTEAVTIAFALRQAAAAGKTCALVTPDRTLARRVTRALGRWQIEPDDTAGEPLAQTPAGRFIRQVADLAWKAPTAEKLIALLKHPLTAAGSQMRLRHLDYTRSVEMHLRRHGLMMLSPHDLPDALTDSAWIDWLFGLVEAFNLPIAEQRDQIARHVALSERVYHGPFQSAGSLWDKDDGFAAKAMFDRLAANSPLVGQLGPHDYLALLAFMMGREQVRPPPKETPIRIWGTVDARIMSADFVVLGGLNEGSWPGTPAFDPWLNRQMRRSLGLRVPERETGLSAHDFQQAISAPEVVLSRSLRSSDAETVPSRWLNRLMTVVGQSGTRVLMKRGDALIRSARQIEEPHSRVPPAPRPAPVPPAGSRPHRMSVTEIEKLARDPYAIYARHVLRLAKLDPLRQSPEPRDRGTVLHKIMENFITEVLADPANLDRRALMRVARAVFETEVPWQAERLVWEKQFDRVADWIVETERGFQRTGQPAMLEKKGEWRLDRPEFTLVAKADRIDVTPEGARIIDYKTKVPDTNQRKLSPQLALEVLMIAANAFPTVAATEVSEGVYFGLNKDEKLEREVFDPDRLHDIQQKFLALITHFTGPDSSFPARRFPGFPGDYDHLARFGEWHDSDDAVPEILT